MILRGSVEGNGKRDAIVDYLKAICIILVVSQHSDLFDRTKPFFLLTIDKAVPMFMLLSGYMAVKTAGSRAFGDQYQIRILGKKFIRFTVPILISFLLWLVLKFISGSFLSLIEIIKCFCLGRFGRGSYYYALMIQFIILAPILLLIVKRLGFHGVILIGWCNFLFDICSSTYLLNQSLYRILIFRYLLAIALGMYLAINKNLRIGDKDLVIMLSLGVIYILLPSIWGYNYRIFTFVIWRRTSMLSMLYVFPIAYMIFINTEGLQESQTWFGKAAGKIGQASYHIMCTQMIYYVVLPRFKTDIYDLSQWGGVVEFFIDIIITVSSGIAFWYIDKKFITGKIVRLWEKNTTT